MGLALCSRGTTLGKGTLRMYPSWSVPTTCRLSMYACTYSRASLGPLFQLKHWEMSVGPFLPVVSHRKIMVHISTTIGSF